VHLVITPSIRYAMIFLIHVSTHQWPLDANGQLHSLISPHLLTHLRTRVRSSTHSSVLLSFLISPHLLAYLLTHIRLSTHSSVSSSVHCPLIYTHTFPHRLSHLSTTLFTLCSLIYTHTIHSSLLISSLIDYLFSSLLYSPYVRSFAVRSSIHSSVRSSFHSSIHSSILSSLTCRRRRGYCSTAPRSPPPRGCGESSKRSPPVGREQTACLWKFNSTHSYLSRFFLFISGLFRLSTFILYFCRFKCWKSSVNISVLFE
jgi:hypothetical protein